MQTTNLQHHWGLNVSRGLTDGASFLKFASNPNVGSSYEDIWEAGGEKTFQTTAQAVEIVSSSTDDVGVAESEGTGARTVRVYGLDGNYVEQIEDVILNGQTAVDLTKTFLDVYRIETLTAGSGGTNAGNLTLRLNGAGATMAYVAAGDGQTLMSQYIIPAGKTGYLTQGYFMSGDTKGTRAQFMVKATPTGVFNVKFDLEVTNSQFTFKPEFPFGFPEKSTLKIRALQTAAASGGRVAAGYELILIDN